MTGTDRIEVPITRPDFGAAESEGVARVVRSGWLLQGKEVAGFEGELAAAVGAAHAIAVCNGTAALELALRALGIKAGDEVITVSHSFIASAACVVAVGATPAFADVEADTLSIDPESARRLLSPRTRALIAVHQVGFPCTLGPLLDLTRAAGIPLIEDAACALGSEIRVAEQWQRIGKPHGAVACFSFHPRKVITVGEGGAITTNDAALAHRLRLLRQHGLEKPAALDRPIGTPDGFALLGTNARMTDLAAVIGRPQLARLSSIITERRRIGDGYCAALAAHPVLTPPQERIDSRSNWQSFPTFLRPDTPWTAAGVLRFLADRGISGRGGLTNAHEEPAFADPQSHRRGPLPVSEALRGRTVFLPLFHGMRPEEENAVLAALDALGRQTPVGCP